MTLFKVNFTILQQIFTHINKQIQAATIITVWLKGKSKTIISKKLIQVYSS